MFVKSGGEKTSNLFIVIVETNLGHAPLFSPLLHGSQLIQKKKKSVSSCAQRIDSLDIVSTIESGYRSTGFLLGVEEEEEVVKQWRRSDRTFHRKQMFLDMVEDTLQILVTFFFPFETIERNL